MTAVQATISGIVVGTEAKPQRLNQETGEITNTVEVSILSHSTIAKVKYVNPKEIPSEGDGVDIVAQFSDWSMNGRSGLSVKFIKNIVQTSAKTAA